MNIFEEYKDKVLTIIKKAEKDKLLILPEKLNGINVDSTPPNINFDVSTNVSMVLSKANNKSPNIIAETIIDLLKKEDTHIKEISFSKPGFINIKFNKDYWNSFANKLINISYKYGSSNKDKKKYLVEFVSANPTGPLHVGHCRGAILGDVISNILKFNNNIVEKEYYVNDYGNQIKKLITSILSKIDKDYQSDEDDLYKGEYIQTIATKIQKKIKGVGDFNIQREIILDEMFKIINIPIHNLNIDFDNWFYESSLFKDDLVEKNIKKLENSGHIIKDNGALMLRAEEPRVLVKSNGDYTYFATDLAYHDLKIKNFDLVIDIWGADHHGYVPRIKAGLRALGHDVNKLDIHLIQFANLFRNGEKVSMSTRKGEFIELESLRKEIGNDAINFFYLTKSKDQHLDFDLSVAIEQNKNNPVFYVQYAHARIEKILNEAKGYESNAYNIESLDNKLEKEIITTLINFNEVLKKSLTELQPHLITHYLVKLSQDFHSYYANVKILDEDIDYSRIHLIAAVQKILKCGLDLLNINAPKEM